MKLKWVIGRKTNFFLAILWAIFAVIDLIGKHWLIGILQATLAIYALNDALRGDEVELLDLKIGKEAK